jgi:hypothetical protein
LLPNRLALRRSCQQKQKSECECLSHN